MKPLSLTALASAGAAIGAVLVATPACGVLFLDGRPCPCATGWICCPEANMCVANAPQCSSLANAPKDQVTPGSIMLTKGQTPQCMTEDADHLYWINSDNRLAAIDKRGGPVVFSHYPMPPAVQPLPTGSGAPLCSLAIGGNYLYATVWNFGKVARISLETEGAWDLGAEGQLFGTLSLPRSLVVDNAFVYVSDFDSGIIKKYPRGAGAGPTDAGTDAATTDATTDAGGGTSLSDAAIWERRVGDHPAWLVADTDWLYWIDGSGLRKMSKSGDGVTTLSVGSFGINAQLAVSDGELFWLGSGVNRLPTSGGTPSSISWPALDAYNDATHGGSGPNWDDDAALRAKEVCPNTSGIGYAAPSAAPGEAATFTMPGAGDPLALAVDDREVFFASPASMNRGPVGAVADTTAAFVYRAVCDPNQGAASIVLLDEAHVYWADQEAIWSHPR
jgi:hypothetical protein